MSKRTADEAAGALAKKPRGTAAANSDDDSDVSTSVTLPKPPVAATVPGAAANSAAAESEDTDGLSVDPADPGGKVDLALYSRRTRPSARPHGTKTDIYISPSRPLAPVLKRMQKLLFTDQLTSVVLHGMGSGGITAAVRAAVDFTDRHQPWLRTSTTTDTQIVTDDYIPLVDGTPAFTRSRRVSSIRILVLKSAEGAAAR